jgi:ribosomal-protein-alanine N-acetyltransferase
MMNLHFPTFPVLQTERLVLRQLAEHDAERIHRLRSDAVVNAAVGRKNSSGVEDALAFIEKIHVTVKSGEGMYWALDMQGSSDLIGTICLWNYDVENDTVEIGYEMLPEFHGKGLMREAIQRVIAFVFDEMNARTITAFPSAGNAPSVALLTAVHFTLDDKRYAHSHEDLADVAIYTLTRTDLA